MKEDAAARRQASRTSNNPLSGNGGRLASPNASTSFAPSRAQGVSLADIGAPAFHGQSPIDYNRIGSLADFQAIAKDKSPTNIRALMKNMVLLSEKIYKSTAYVDGRSTNYRLNQPLAYEKMWNSALKNLPRNTQKLCALVPHFTGALQDLSKMRARNDMVIARVDDLVASFPRYASLRGENKALIDREIGKLSRLTTSATASADIEQTLACYKKGFWPPPGALAGFPQAKWATER